MEVDIEHTRPGTASPGNPLNSAPRYSPITPEAGTPAPGAVSPDVHMQDGDEANGQPDHATDDASRQLSRLGPLPPNNLPAPAAILTYEPQNGALGHANSFSEAPSPFEKATERLRQIGAYDDNFDHDLPPVIEDSAFSDPAASTQDSDRKVRAFAKIEFPDGQFYMSTYAVEIGRDINAARKAERLMLNGVVNEHHRRESETSRKDGSNPELERMSRSARHEAHMSAAASVISGGIMNLEAGEEPPRRRGRRSRRNKSAPSSIQGPSYHTPFQQPGETNYQALANASLFHGSGQQARPVDLTNMMPSPDEVPLIPIYPGASIDQPAGTKSISRKHARISYNPEKGLFEIFVLGRNGCFVDETFIGPHETHILASGTTIQIGGVSFKFILPNVPDGETGTEMRSDAVSQSGISMDFEDGMGESADVDEETPTTDNEDDRYRELRLAQRLEPAWDEDEDDDEMDEDEDEDDEDEEPIPVRRSAKQSHKQSKHAKASGKAPVETRPKIKLKMSLKKADKAEKTREEPEPQPVKRKGPGRPPKNGIMSKREEAEIRRKEKEAAKAKKVEAMQVKQEEAEEVEASPNERRKAQKKKKEEEIPAQEEQPSEVIESIEKAEGDAPAESRAAAPAPKPPKEKRPPKPPRSPSPVWDESTLTPEQLAKPTQSYVVLIHEALSNHPKGQMSLPQIYRAIERKYPYYKLRVTTVGWQSSVRHNLSQHPAFIRIERDGKGWMWGLDKNISIEREKKRRPSPPPMQAPNMYGVGNNAFARPYQQNGFMGPIPNGQGQIPPQNPYAVWPNNPQAGRGYGPPNAMPRPPFAGAQPGSNIPATYQSPYDSSRNTTALGQTNPPQGQVASAGPSQVPPPYLTQNRPGATGALALAQHTPGAASTGQAGTAGQPAPQPQLGQHPGPGGPVVQNGTLGQQGQARTPGPPPAFSPPPPPNNPHGIPNNIWLASQKFREVLLKSLKAVPQADVIVREACDKCLGILAPPGAPYKDNPQEKSVIAAMTGFLTKMNWPVEEKIAIATGKRPAPPVNKPAFQPPPVSAAATNPAPVGTNPMPVTATAGTTPVQQGPPPPVQPGAGQAQTQASRPSSGIQPESTASGFQPPPAPLGQASPGQGQAPHLAGAATKEQGLTVDVNAAGGEASTEQGLKRARSQEDIVSAAAQNGGSPKVEMPPAKREKLET